MNSISRDKLQAEFAPKTGCEWYPGDFKATVRTADATFHFNSEGQTCYREIADSGRRHLDNRTVDQSFRGAGLFLGVGRETLPGKYPMDINTLDRAAVVFEKGLYLVAVVGTINVIKNDESGMSGLFEGTAVSDGVSYKFEGGEFSLKLK
ncbi:hypothetical protein [Pseudomonas sp. efr-133-TYG-5]|jgi:hypothetical protein|uniref:hypothetical protein n=1 Tax=Pseudomonas sp. efr-133-TYG-5 TaxID=3040310 RepID=UPI002557297C|nr:hypothetical protein [Pseudomonas sp. efr-133-TYG-5]